MVSFEPWCCTPRVTSGVFKVFPGKRLRKLCIEMGFHQHRPTIIYEDCEAAVALSKETRFRKRSKHIALRWHFIAERQDPQVSGGERTGRWACGGGARCADRHSARTGHGVERPHPPRASVLPRPQPVSLAEDL